MGGPQRSKAKLVGPLALVTDPDKKRAYFESNPDLVAQFSGPEDRDFVMYELKPESVEIETVEEPDPFDDMML